MLLSVILYGSRARGDHRSISDVDMLGIIESGPLKREVAAGGTSMYHYPVDLLQKDSAAGNLFVLHIVSEGKVLHDTLDCFETVKSKFVYKDSYESEIQDASLIIEFFLVRRHVLKQKAARKRLVWAIRTILIARAAEQGNAIFSSNALAAFSRMSDLKSAIDNRSTNEIADLINAAIKVVKKFGSEKNHRYIWPSDKYLQREIMKNRGGIVADTLRFVQPPALIKLQNSKALLLGDNVKFSYNK